MSASVVELRLPAQSPFVAVIRMTTAGLAARQDFTLEDIEDLRMAVGEACALLLENAVAEATLTVRYQLREAQMDLTVALDNAADTTVDRDSFGWQVLSALVEDLSEASGPDGCAISFTITSTKA